MQTVHKVIDSVSEKIHNGQKVANYTVVDKGEDYEVRKYYPCLAVEVQISGSHEQAGTNGFSILADYMGGNNIKKTKIDLTAPVLEFTVGSDKYAVQLFLPIKWEKEDLP